MAEKESKIGSSLGDLTTITGENPLGNSFNRMIIHTYLDAVLSTYFLKNAGRVNYEEVKQFKTIARKFLESPEQFAISAVQGQSGNGIAISALDNRLSTIVIVNNRYSPSDDPQETPEEFQKLRVEFAKPTSRRPIRLARLLPAFTARLNPQSYHEDITCSLVLENGEPRSIPRLFGKSEFNAISNLIQRVQMYLPPVGVV